jgi:CubicO group peptidase (beta-lactamase class C family)
VNTPRVRGTEVAAANGSATARGLAKVYAMLALGGEIDGVRIVSSESVELFRKQSVFAPAVGMLDVPLPNGEFATQKMRYGLGYALNQRWPGGSPLYGPVDTSFGHNGAGGQLGFADPVNRLAVGYVRNHLTVVQDHSAALLDSVYSCSSPGSTGSETMARPVTFPENFVSVPPTAGSRSKASGARTSHSCAT